MVNYSWRRGLVLRHPHTFQTATPAWTAWLGAKRRVQTRVGINRHALWPLESGTTTRFVPAKGQQVTQPPRLCVLPASRRFKFGQRSVHFIDARRLARTPHQEIQVIVAMAMINRARYATDQTDAFQKS